MQNNLSIDVHMIFVTNNIYFLKINRLYYKCDTYVYTRSDFSQYYNKRSPSKHNSYKKN